MAQGRYRVVGRHAVFGVEPGGVVDMSQVGESLDSVVQLVAAGHLEKLPEQEAAPEPEVQHEMVVEAAEQPPAVQDSSAAAVAE